MDVRLSDLALLGPTIADDGQSGRFELARGMVRHDGGLYGGTGLAVSVLAMQAATRREVLWASCQFVSSANLGDTLEWTTEVLATGKRASQLAVRATSGDRVAFTAIGSAGIPSDDGLTGQYQAMPTVSSPLESTAAESFATAINPDSYTQRLEMYEAEVVGPGPDAALWVRRRDGEEFTPVGIVFAADFVPLGIARAAGKIGAGSSLDNTMRFRGGTGAEWILLDLVGDFAFGGYGHGTVRVWSEDGELLATGSQSAAMRYLWDEGDEPKISAFQG